MEVPRAGAAGAQPDDVLNTAYRSLDVFRGEIRRQVGEARTPRRNPPSLMWTADLPPPEVFVAPDAVPLRSSRARAVACEMIEGRPRWQPWRTSEREGNEVGEGFQGPRDGVARRRVAVRQVQYR